MVKSPSREEEDCQNLNLHNGMIFFLKDGHQEVGSSEDDTRFVTRAEFL